VVTLDTNERFGHLLRTSSTLQLRVAQTRMVHLILRYLMRVSMLVCLRSSLQ
jgi:hypothetical protein